MTSAVNLFLDSTELESVIARGTFWFFARLSSVIQNVGKVLKAHTVCVACYDGGYQTNEAKIPAFMWHLANHRLELSVCDTVKSVTDVIDASPKNAIELKVRAKLLNIELLKFSRILGTRCVVIECPVSFSCLKELLAISQSFLRSKEWFNAGRTGNVPIWKITENLQQRTLH
jgi:hypothetical protein